MDTAPASQRLVHIPETHQDALVFDPIGINRDAKLHHFRPRFAVDRHPKSATPLPRTAMIGTLHFMRNVLCPQNQTRIVRIRHIGILRDNPDPVPMNSAVRAGNRARVEMGG